MSHALTFDTLAFVKKLEASGIAPRQSEAITEAFANVFEYNLSAEVFTKTDAKNLEGRIEYKFDAKLAKLKSELIVWIVGILFAQTAIIISIMKFMH